MEAFQYQQLTKTQIRLIRIIDNEKVAETNVQVQLQAFSLAQLPTYTALSYRWGSPEKTQTILVDNGKFLKITKSLEIFLQEVIWRQRRVKVNSEQKTNCSTDSWVSGWIWIDAVCINQNDSSERSQQVRMMREIYEYANTIVIWLGEGQPGTDEAFDVLESIAELDLDDEEQGEGLRLTEGSMPEVSCRLDTGKSSVEILYETLFDIGDLLRDQYWERVWIIQEASTPKDESHTIACAGQGCSIDWETFVRANQRLLFASWNNEVQQQANLHGIAGGDIATLQYMQDRRRSRIYAEPLYTLLVRCRTAAATDPRDKVFALLGLAEERNHPSLQPDYTASVERVYVTVAMTIIKLTNSLDSLGSACMSRNPTLPSWVPDWTLQHTVVPQPFYQYSQLWNVDGSLKERQNLFQASKGLAPYTSFEENDRRLVVKGFQFDVVSAISVPRQYRDGLSSKDTWSNWWDLASAGTHAPYVNGCSRREALERVVCADVSSVWGDWSAERHTETENLTAGDVDAFERGNPIIDAMTWGRRLFTTPKGYMGLAPYTIEANDIVCIMAGSQMPLLLRRNADVWFCVGQVYIHGIMDGEAVSLSANVKLDVFMID